MPFKNVFGLLSLIFNLSSRWESYFKTGTGNSVYDGLYEEKVKPGGGGKEHVAIIQIIVYIAVISWTKAKSMEIEAKEWIRWYFEVTSWGFAI